MRNLDYLKDQVTSKIDELTDEVYWDNGAGPIELTKVYYQPKGKPKGLVWSKVVNLTIPDGSSNLDVSQFIIDNNPLDAPTVNIEVADGSVVGRLYFSSKLSSKVDVFFTNKGQIQGSPAGNAVELYRPITLINEGSILAGGGHGGRGGDGADAANGIDGTARKVTWNTYTTIPYNAIMNTGEGHFTQLPPGYVEVPWGTWGFKGFSSWSIIANNTIEGKTNFYGPCGAKYLSAVVAAGSASGDSSQKLCTVFPLHFVVSAHFLPVVFSSILLPQGSIYKDGTDGTTIYGTGTGGVGGVGGNGCTGGSGVGFNVSQVSRITSCSAQAGTNGTNGTTNTYLDPNGNTQYGYPGTDGYDAGDGGYGGAGGSWGKNGEAGGFGTLDSSLTSSGLNSGRNTGYSVAGIGIKNWNSMAIKAYSVSGIVAGDLT